MRQRGTGSHYSNIDLEVLGLVIEKATGQALPLPHRLMRGRLLSPAMLDSMRTRSFWSGGDMPACGGRAFGHSG
jgi:CubicO group peptidase (beta-lactamase class C family)